MARAAGAGATRAVFDASARRARGARDGRGHRGGRWCRARVDARLGGGVDGKGAWEGDDDSRGRAPGRDGRRTGAKAERRPRAATGGGVGEDD